MPSVPALLEQMGPAFAAHADGEHEKAWAIFLSAVSGLDWPTCEQLLDGSVAQLVKDADTLFDIELPSLGEWAFAPEQAAAIECPALSVVGTETGPVWVETAEFLRTTLPHVEERVIDGVGHLLHAQRPEPVARAMAEFFRSHPMTSG